MVSLLDPIKAKVINGRLVVDEPTTHPEGAVIELTPVDFFDILQPQERRLLEDSIARSLQELESGEGVDHDQVMTDLRSLRK